MAYDPENNPYIPGDPASYDLSWVVERLNEHKFAEESAAEAKDLAEAAAASAQDASGYANDAESYKNAASGFADDASRYADNAEGYRDEAADYAARIADPVSGLVTAWLDDNITQPTTPIVDASLMISGAAADAKVAGERIDSNESAISECTQLEPTIPLNYVNDEPGYVWQELNGVLTKRTGAAFSTFHICTFEVEELTYYDVTGCLYAPITPICIYADSNNNVLGSSETPTTVTPQYTRMLRTIRIKTPENCAYIYVNFIALDKWPTVIKCEYVNTFDMALAYIADNKQTMDSSESAAAWRYVNGGYSKSTGGAFAYWHTDKFNVIGGKHYEISGSRIIAVPIAVMFNSDGTAIGHIGDVGTSYNPENVTIKTQLPTNCAYICVNAFTIGLDALVYECEPKSSYYNRWLNKKWCVIGDSLTANNSTSIKKYFEFITQFSGIEVANNGMGGTGYANPGAVNNNFTDRMANIPTDCDIYTFFGSFNDIQYGISNNIPIGTPSDSSGTMCGYFNSAFDALFARIPLANVGVIAPCPWNGINAVGSSALCIYGQDYVAALEAVCKRRSIPFLNLFENSGFRPWDADFVSLIYTHDTTPGVHPNEIGQQILSTKIEAFLNNLIN